MIKLEKSYFDSRYFKYNEYLEKYIQLITNNQNKNLNTKNKLLENHHVLPVCYYRVLYNCKNRKKALSYANEDLKNFQINLTCRDHILAHYYLCMCSKDVLKKFLCFSFISMTDQNKDKLLNDEYLFFKKLPEYTQLREERNKYNSEHNKGRVAWNKGKKVGNHPKSEHALLKSREAGIKRRGSIWINKGKINKLIKKSQWNFYRNLGWNRGLYISDEAIAKGILKSRNTRNSKKVAENPYSFNWLTNGEIDVQVFKWDQPNYDKYINSGFWLGRTGGRHVYTEIEKQKLSEKIKNTLVIYNALGTIKRIKFTDLNYYLSLGWKRGNPKISIANSLRKPVIAGRIRICNSQGENKLIKKEDLDSHLKLGWKLGQYYISSETETCLINDYIGNSDLTIKQLETKYGLKETNIRNILKRNHVTLVDKRLIKNRKKLN